MAAARTLRKGDLPAGQSVPGRCEQAKHRLFDCPPGPDCQIGKPRGIRVHPRRNRILPRDDLPDMGAVRGVDLCEDDAAHFHARYGTREITVRRADDIVEGRFPRRALSLRRGDISETGNHSETNSKRLDK